MNPLDSPGDNPVSSGLTGFRLAGALVGLFLMLAGAYFASRLFVFLYDGLTQPQSFHELLDKWEGAVRGRIPDFLTEGEDAAASQADDTAAASGANASTSRSVRARDVVSPIDAAEYVAAVARPFAILVVITLIGILVRLALALITAGGSLVSQMSGEALALKRILNDMWSRGNR